MGFLDNSGDIILDAVLTDTGRKRLARGDGSFNVAKFALADDEINYNLYNKNHSSGSAYYDLEILQTPVLEAFTNNTSTMKSKLITISRTNLLYLPVIKINEDKGAGIVSARNSFFTGNIHVVSVDSDSTNALQTYVDAGNTFNYIKGNDPATSDYAVYFDQGIDSADQPPTTPIDPDLKETQYIVHIDHRLGSLAKPDGSGDIANFSFLDDDNIATYYFTSGGTTGNNSGFVTDLGTIPSTESATAGSSLSGKRGTRFGFKIRASDNLENSEYLFDEIGLSSTVTINSQSYKVLDSIIKVMGATTGYSVEIPIRFIKKT